MKTVTEQLRVIQCSDFNCSRLILENNNDIGDVLGSLKLKLNTNTMRPLLQTYRISTIYSPRLNI